MRFLTLYSGIDKGRREIVVRPEVSARHMIIVSPIAIVLLTNWEKKTILQVEKAFRETYRSLLPFPSQCEVGHKKHHCLDCFPLLILLEATCSGAVLELFQMFISLVLDFALLCG